jgi:predicted SpoU family rRNA methylase
LVVDSRREAEEWMGSIEYLRTKASVDKFITKFGGNVKLQLNNDFQPILSNYQMPSKIPATFGN